MNSNMVRIVPNFVFFQVGWFACVLSGAANQPIIGLLVAVLILAFHLWRADAPQFELALLAIALLIGAIWDSWLVALSLLDYTSGTLLPNTAPYWIVVLWALFASTINVSMRWLKAKYWTAALLGAIAGPLAYVGGERLGALQFIDLEWGLMALALGWALFTPLLVFLSMRFDGYSSLSRRSQ